MTLPLFMPFNKHGSFALRNQRSTTFNPSEQGQTPQCAINANTVTCLRYSESSEERLPHPPPPASLAGIRRGAMGKKVKGLAKAKARVRANET